MFSTDKKTLLVVAIGSIPLTLLGLRYLRHRETTVVTPKDPPTRPPLQLNPNLDASLSANTSATPHHGNVTKPPSPTRPPRAAENNAHWTPLEAEQPTVSGGTTSTQSPQERSSNINVMRDLNPIVHAALAASGRSEDALALSRSGRIPSYIRRLSRASADSPTSELTPVPNSLFMEIVVQFATQCAAAPIGDRATMTQTIAKEICQMTNATAVNVWIYEPSANVLLNYAKRDLISCQEDNIIPQSFRTGQPVQLGEDYATPMIAGGNVLAVIHVKQNPMPTPIPIEHDTADPTTPNLPGMSLSKDMVLLDTMAAIGAMFLQNNSTFDALSTNKEQTDAMLRMARMLSQDTLDESTLVSAIMHSARELCEADRCSLFLVDRKRTMLRAHFEEHARPVEFPISSGIAGYVARTADTVNITNAYKDRRFNPDVDRKTGYRTETILCLPVSFEGQIVAVAQLINKHPMVVFGKETPRTFTKDDETRFSSFSAFVGVCLRNCRASQELREQKTRVDTVLEMAAKISTTDIRNLDEILSFILREAQNLLHADRASIFMVDKERDRLHSREKFNTAGIDIKVEVNKGIVGVVAATGKADIVDDVYADPRFNQQIDRETGYKTTSMITVPIFSEGGKGEVIAVAQLINKLESGSDRHVPFNEDDHQLFRQFALFAGMALSNANLLQFAVNAGEEAIKLNNMTKEGKVLATPKALHHAVKQAAFEEYTTTLALDYPEELNTKVKALDFDMFAIRKAFGPEVSPHIVCRLITHLIWSTGYPMQFGADHDTVLRFVLACRRKYRQVPYHNFFHAADVCQTVYCYLVHGKAQDMFEPLECYVLLITALVHDLDHMGLNNSYHMKTSSPLGILSSATGTNCVLEVHHCNLAFEILEQSEQDVFKGLESGARINAVRLMVDCILATDMARHGECCKTFQKLSVNGPSPFDRSKHEHRLVAMQQLTKAADISNVTKPFAISKLWGKSVTEEFYRQGDREREAGVDVLPMNDRRLGTELAKGQLGFISFLAEGFFRSLVEDLFVDMRYIFLQLEKNKESWHQELELSSIAAGNVC